MLLGLPPLAHIASDELWVTLGVSVVRGVGFGISPSPAAVAELVEPTRRGEAIGVYGLATAVPQLLLLPGSSWLAQQVGFWLVFAISATLLLGIGPALGARRRHRAPGAAARRPG